MNLLADTTAWAVVLLISVLEVGLALIPYDLGKHSVEAVLERFPRLDPEHLERVQVLYQKHGSGLLFFSFIPILGLLLTAGAGIVRVRLPTFVLWVLAGRVLRNSILLVLLDQGLHLLGGQ